MSRTRIGIALLAAPILLGGAARAADKISRMDLLDKDGNALLFVTFEYDQGGKNTSRTVYTADSTFLRRTTFEDDGAGKRTKEKSSDFNGDPAYQTTFSSAAGKTTFSVLDQFGLDQLGGPVSYAASGANDFEISQGGAVINRLSYTYGADNALQKIAVLDKGGTALYSAVFSSASPIAGPYRRVGAVLAPAMRLSGYHCVVSFQLLREATITLDLHSLSGRHAASLLKRSFKPGLRSAHVTPSDGNAHPSAGVYMLRLSVDGVAVLNKPWAVHQR